MSEHDPDEKLVSLKAPDPESERYWHGLGLRLAQYRPEESRSVRWGRAVWRVFLAFSVIYTLSQMQTPEFWEWLRVTFWGSGSGR